MKRRVLLHDEELCQARPVDVTHKEGPAAPVGGLTVLSPVAVKRSTSGLVSVALKAGPSTVPADGRHPSARGELRGAYSHCLRLAWGCPWTRYHKKGPFNTASSSLHSPFALVAAVLTAPVPLPPASPSLETPKAELAVAGTLSACPASAQPKPHPRRALPSTSDTLQPVDSEVTGGESWAVAACG